MTALRGSSNPSDELLNLRVALGIPPNLHLENGQHGGGGSVVENARAHPVGKWDDTLPLASPGLAAAPPAPSSCTLASAPASGFCHWHREVSLRILPLCSHFLQTLLGVSI